MAAILSLLFSQIAGAETIIKLTFGSTGPDIQLDGGVLSTVDDGVTTSSPGDQQSTVDFDGFVETSGGLVDIVIPEQGSFSLFGVDLVGEPGVDTIGPFTRIDQATTGGSFELYDQNGTILLTGTMTDGLLSGSPGGAAAGSFFAANLGTFTGPSSDELNKLFAQLDPDSASLSISLTDVIASDSTPGLQLVGGVLRDFTADATGNVSAESIGNVVPEPSSVSLVLCGLLGLLSLRRRQR